MLYELTLSGRLASQQWVCRWNYVSSGVGASVSGSFGLMNAFGCIPDALVVYPEAPFKNLMRLPGSDCVVDSAVVRAASDYDVEDFYERPFVTPYSGGSGEVVSSPVLSFGFRTNRVRLDVARGTKRLPGISEGSIGAGGVIAGATFTLMGEVADWFSQVLTYDDEGSTFTYTPCVVAKLEYTTPSGKKAYKYYPTLETQLEHVAQGVTWQPYNTVRTQNSRQYGRGI